MVLFRSLRKIESNTNTTINNKMTIFYCYIYIIVITILIIIHNKLYNRRKKSVYFSKFY